jgi:hypothetical protein
MTGNISTTRAVSYEQANSKREEDSRQESLDSRNFSKGRIPWRRKASTRRCLSLSTRIRLSSSVRLSKKELQTMSSTSTTKRWLSTSKRLPIGSVATAAADT